MRERERGEGGRERRERRGGERVEGGERREGERERR